MRLSCFSVHPHGFARVLPGILQQRIAFPVQAVQRRIAVGQVHRQVQTEASFACRVGMNFRSCSVLIRPGLLGGWAKWEGEQFTGKSPLQRTPVRGCRGLRAWAMAGRSRSSCRACRNALWASPAQHGCERFCGGRPTRQAVSCGTAGTWTPDRLLRPHGAWRTCVTVRRS